MRIIPGFISFVVFLLSASSAGAQNCGCADEGNCPLQFPAATNTQVCYDITDALNNNLASPTQGVCGVYVKFRHGRIGSLDLTLTSPSGQQVQLVGTNGNCNTFTPLATWDILFVPCAATCAPDTIGGNCPYPCVFDGCPAPCPWGSATYSGLYQPFSGCLEDFDTGPANGQWCIEIGNNAQFNGGTVLDFEVIFCDQSGILCCDADAGNIPDPNVNACLGDSSLLLDLDPVYGAIVPDTAEYGYTFAIFSNGTLATYDTVLNLMPYPAGTYTVCGLSYLLADASALPAEGTVWTPQSLNDTLTSANPPLCADIGLNCVVVQIANPPPVTVLRDTICDGQSVVFDGQTITTAGLYADTLASFFGCDSLVNFTLTVMPNETTSLTQTVCSGDSVTVGSSVFNTSGNYTVMLQTAFGCDSTVTLDLTVLPQANTMLTEIICEGESITVGSTTYSTTGIYVDTLASFFNCDSTVTLDLTVVEINLSVAQPDTLDCLLTSVPLGSNATTTFGVLSYQWTTIGGSFIGPTDQPTATATAPGDYILTVQAAGCSVADTVTVVQNANLPNAVIVPSDNTLTCAITDILLNGSTSSPVGNISWGWSAQGGSPIQNPLTLTPIVNGPDVYQLIVTNLLNNCKDTTTVAILQNITPPVANAGTGPELSCTVPTVNLDGAASAPAGGISFAWSSMDGNILPPANIATPAVDEPGTYQLIVTDLVNACQDTDLVVVTVDTLTPNAVIALPQGNFLNCDNGTLTLDGSASTGSQNVVFQWIGNILTGQGTPVATTITPGNYTLLLTDTLNGCTDLETVSIGTDFVFPNADAGPDDSITCTQITVQLGGPGSSIGPDFGYEWAASPGGIFTSGTDSNLVTVASEGIYALTVTNLLNGCSDTDVAVVENNSVPPVADAGPGYVLNCTDTEFILDASNSTVVPFAIFEWTNSAGTVISNDVQVTVDYPDTFIFTIVFAFCESSDTVVVAEGTVAPVAIAGPDLLLDCLTGQATLDGNGSDVGLVFTYLWTTADGNIVSGETGLLPVVDTSGTYVLQVTNSSTGCVSFDTALVTLDPVACVPVANAGADGFFNCFGQTFTDTLLATASMGPDFSYSWTAISGSVLNQTDPFAPIVTAGEFVFTVTNNAVGLSATDTVLVVADTLTPVADAGPFILSLGCDELAACFQLDASNSSTGPQFAYEWETGITGGSICGSPNVLNAEVLGEDVYTLTVTNLLNGCQAEDGVLVQLLDFPAVADIGPDIQIPCSVTTATPDGSGSSIGPNFTYEWFSFGGTIVANGNTHSAEVMPNNPSDTFFLVVLNTLNSCRDTDDVVVFAPVNCNPVCNATASGTLDCNVDTVFLSAAGSSVGADISYLWTTVNGTLCGGETTATACASAPGIYDLTVTRTYPNGSQFTSTCQVQVFENTQPPVANAGPDDDLNCTDNMLTLNGSASSGGPGIAYLWTTTGGNLCGGETTNSACADAPGTYFLLVTNTLNGCTAIDSMGVGVDTLHPTAEAGPGDMLTCNSSTIVLTGSAVPANVSYLWTTFDGDICAGGTTPDPVVCDAGTYYLTVTIVANGCTATDSTIVTQDPNLPDPDAGPPLSYTCANQVFVVNASVTGGNVLGYQWVASNGGCITGPSDVLQPTVACPGTYTLTVTDLVTNCQAIAQMQVIDNTAPPMAVVGIPQEINCQNPIVTLDGSGSTPAGQLDFLWTTLDGNIVSGETTAMPQVDTAGTYLLTVTNQQTQCTATASVLVTIDANIPAVAAGTDTTLTCTRTSLKLNGTGSAVGPGILYEWTTNDGQIVSDPTTLMPVIDRPGTYTLTVEDTGNSCIVSESVTVTMDTVPPAAVIDQSQVLTITCDVQQVTLLGNLSSPPDSLVYFWKTQDGVIFIGTNAANAVVTSAGTYLLTVTHQRNGCQDSTTIDVGENLTPPQVLLAQPQVLDCDHPQVQLGVLPPGGNPLFSYLWSGPGPILDPTTPAPTVSEAGVYHVTVTDTTNGCESDSSVLVTENFAVPDALAATLGQLDCDHLTVQVTGQGSSSGSVSYAWTTTGPGNIASPTALVTEVDAPGWYFFTVKNLDNGCSKTDSTLVIASAQPIENALITLEHPDCLDPDGYIYIDSVLGGTPPYFYSLDGDIFIDYPQFSYLDEGAHTLVVKDGNGCSWTDTLVLLGPGEVLVELGPDLTITQGEDAELEAQISIPLSEVDSIWWENLPDTVECPQCLVQVVMPEETTTYHIHVIDTNGCSAMDKITVVVNEERPFYVPTAFSPNGDGTNDRLLLYAGPDVAVVHSFRIFDRWGNLVFQEKDFQPSNPQIGWDGHFEGQPLNPAVFVWMADVEFVDGSLEVFYGEVTLVR
ncbi:MAG: gliding motility-associated C-terminal domain-containing protein [Bacteroidetes bacterium]|nr:gliding motility-associated C-terminal domain-containing protein [Bacteroidota bacterium]